MSKNDKLDKKKIGYPYQILDNNMTLEEVKDVYCRALKRGKEKGFTPVIVTADDMLDEYFNFCDDKYNAEDALQKIGDGREFLNGVMEEMAEYDDVIVSDEFSVDLIGEMADGEAIDQFTSVIDFMDGSLLSCALVEVPTDKPWEVVVCIPFGGWNECPAPEDMASVCKYWYEQYGAYPAVITHDTLEFYVEKPVAKEKAMELAKEHFLFCSDRVYQGTRNCTIGEVADCLWQSDIWYFWWD